QLLPSIYISTNVGHASLVVYNHMAGSLEEFAAVVNGSTPYVDYFPHYQNILPVLVEPLFKAVHLGIGSFTGFMALLSLAQLCMALAVLLSVTRSRALALLLFVPYAAALAFPIDVPEAIPMLQREL